MHLIIFFSYYLYFPLVIHYFWCMLCMYYVYCVCYLVMWGGGGNTGEGIKNPPPKLEINNFYIQKHLKYFLNYYKLLHIHVYKLLHAPNLFPNNKKNVNFYNFYSELEVIDWKVIPTFPLLPPSHSSITCIISVLCELFMLYTVIFIKELEELAYIYWLLWSSCLGSISTNFQ